MAAVLSLAVLSGVFSLICLVGGLRGLSQARPVVISFRWVTWVLVPVMILAIVIALPDTSRRLPRLSFGIWVELAMLVMGGLVFLAWWRDSDYEVIGARWEDLQRALQAALDAQSLPFRSDGLSLQLPSLSAEIRIVNFSDTTGSAQLTIRPRRHLPYLQAVARAMNEQFAANPGEPRLLAFRIFTGAGALAFVLSLMAIAGVVVG